MPQVNAIEIDHQSGLVQEDAEKLIGKKIIGVKAFEQRLILFLEGGLELAIKGHNWEDSPLDVEVEQKEVT